MGPNLSALLQEVKDSVDCRLMAAIDTLAGDQSPLKPAMRYSLTNGGKRIRPLLVYASARAIAPHHSDSLDCIGAALEAIHAYSLVHDDLPAMDDDELRRGKPTTHIAFDEATAILAGDALQTLAFELLTEAPLTADLRIQLIKRLAQASGARGMVLGQAIDIQAVNQTLTLAELENMHRLKTGALIDTAVQMGALAAGANDAQLAALARYAQAIGLAFQVQDDILDVISDTETLGKQQGADCTHNKPTYVSLLGLPGAQDKAQELYNSALEALAGFDQAADSLRELAAYIVQRRT